MTVSYRGSDLGDAEIKVKGGNAGQGVSGCGKFFQAWAALLSQLEVLYYTETSHEIVVYGVAIVAQARWKVGAPPPIVS